MRKLICYNCDEEEEFPEYEDVMILPRGEVEVLYDGVRVSYHNGQIGRPDGSQVTNWLLGDWIRNKMVQERLPLDVTYDLVLMPGGPDNHKLSEEICYNISRPILPTPEAKIVILGYWSDEDLNLTSRLGSEVVHTDTIQNVGLWLSPYDPGVLGYAFRRGYEGWQRMIYRRRTEGVVISACNGALNVQVVDKPVQTIFYEGLVGENDWCKGRRVLVDNIAFRGFHSDLREPSIYLVDSCELVKDSTRNDGPSGS